MSRSRQSRSASSRAKHQPIKHQSAEHRPENRTPDNRTKDRNRKGRILLLEDHEALANLRRDFLMGQGYELACSGSGEDAIRLLESQPFHLLIADALLSDTVLPDNLLTHKSSTSRWQHAAISGWDVAAIARRLGVPVILSSGWPVRLGAQELRNRGIDYLCPKPCSLHQLLYLVENALGRLSMPRQAIRESAKPVLKTQYESHSRKSDH